MNNLVIIVGLLALAAILTSFAIGFYSIYLYAGVAGG